MTLEQIRPQEEATLLQTSAHLIPARLVRGVSCRNLAQSAAVQLGQRDAALLGDLALYSVMLAEHIQALYFGGCSRRRMNQRLQQLVTAGLLVRRPLPLGLSAGQPLSEASNSIPFVYRLGGAAGPVVASLLGWDVAEVRRLIRQGTPTAAAHALEIVRLRVQAEQAIREWNAQTTASPGGTSLAMEFLPERRLHHRYELRVLGGQWRDEVFKPDALIKLAWAAGQWRYWFIEADLGHTSSAEWEIKANIAARYRRSSLFQKRYAADDFGTLILTTGKRRQAHLRQLLMRCLPPEDAVHFGIATFKDIATHGLLAPLWHLPDTEQVCEGRVHEGQGINLEGWPPAASLKAGMFSNNGKKPS